jgi:glycerol-3-phosphate dehydrogenase
MHDRCRLAKNAAPPCRMATGRRTLRGMPSDRPRSAVRPSALPGVRYDVVVIGGGINGVGVARDCALRGLSVALFERHDLGFGASGNSTGFVHGGPRYLLTDPQVTRDSCVDSGIIQQIAPHLVFRVPVLVPIDRRRGHWSLTLHDAFFRAYDRFQPLKRGQRHTRLDAAELRRLEPGLRGDFVGAVTFDEWGIDGVRLCVLNALDAAERGATVRNHSTVVRILRGGAGSVRGVRVVDALTGERETVAAQVVVNATGAWAPLTATLGGIPPEAVPVRPGKGIHVYFDRRLSNYAVIVPAVDGRSVFVLPWQNATVIGTTDDDFYGDLDDVVATSDEVRYLMQAVARVFPSVQEARVVGTWAGVRPTLFEWGKNADSLSRGHRIVDHADHGVPGLFSMIGGKLASYRLFAQQMSDVVVSRLGTGEPCRTATLPLPGAHAEVDVVALARRAGIDRAAMARLVYRHGARAEAIVERIARNAREGARVCACEPVTEAEIRFVIENELARTVADVARRTRLGLGACGAMHCAARCGAIVAQATGCSALEGRSQARDLLAWTARRRLPALGPDQARQEVLLRASWRAELGLGEP